MRALTKNQTHVLTTLFKAESFHDTPDSQKMDLDQLIEKVPYNVTKESIQFTLRFLVKRGYVEKAGTESRRGKRRVLWNLTKPGQILTSSNCIL